MPPSFSEASLLDHTNITCTKEEKRKILVIEGVKTPFRRDIVNAQIISRSNI